MMDHLNRRDFLAAMAALSAAAIPGCARSITKTERKLPNSLMSGVKGRPNIVLIVTDQERRNLPEAEGYSLPAHERLAEKGTTFTNYHVNTAPCTPSRSNIVTGQHVPLTRMFDNINFPYVENMSERLQTAGSMMRAVGYYTAYKGKWHLSRGGNEDSKKKKKSFVNALEPLGYADFNPSGDFHGSAQCGFKHDGEIAQSAREWLLTKGKGFAGEMPFFLTVGFVNPHDIMFADNDGPEGKVQVLGGPFEGLPFPSVLPYTNQWKFELPKTYGEDISKKPKAQMVYREMMDFLFGDMPFDKPELYRTNLNYYLNCIRDVDRHIGTVLDALDEAGLADNTVVMFTSDHGEMGGSHGQRQKGPLIYQENMNVPLIVRHPDSAGGVVTEALASSVDLAPTLLSIAGLSQERIQTEFPQLAGHDFSSALTSASAPSGRDSNAGGILFTYDSLYSVDVDFMRALDKLMQKGVRGLELTVPIALRPDFRSNRGFMRGIFDGRYKFNRYFAPLDFNRPRTLEELLAHNDIELYDTRKDPLEATNLAHDMETNKELVVAMSDKLEALIQDEIGEDKSFNMPDIPRLRPMAFQR